MSVHREGVCGEGGLHGEGGVHGRGHAWQGGVSGKGGAACVLEGVHGRAGHAWQGACMAGVHGREHAWLGEGHVWQGVHGRVACVAEVDKATAADGTHPTGMHSCSKYGQLVSEEAINQ